MPVRKKSFPLVVGGSFGDVLSKSAASSRERRIGIGARPSRTEQRPDSSTTPGLL